MTLIAILNKTVIVVGGGEKEKRGVRGEKNMERGLVEEN
jgi:hypothetical protein